LIVEADVFVGVSVAQGVGEFCVGGGAEVDRVFDLAFAQQRVHLGLGDAEAQ
jgi:hypothetical protein